jgi:4-hydroxyphenylacetate decarboxylase small subunit
MIEQPVSVLQHNDCRNFCSVDVAKGICRRTGEMVAIDDAACTECVPLPKCKFCGCYSPGIQSGLGACLAEAGQPWAYPEMIAVTCELFEWKKS